MTINTFHTLALLYVSVPIEASALGIKFLTRVARHYKSKENSDRQENGELTRISHVDPDTIIDLSQPRVVELPSSFTILTDIPNSTLMPMFSRQLYF